MQGAGAEMRRTLGTAVFAGMLGVTLFGIFLTPVFYFVIQRLNDMRKKAPPRLPGRGWIKSGDDLLSRCSHYHRPQVLNGRVRNGNGCGHLGMVTGKTLRLSVVSRPLSVVRCQWRWQGQAYVNWRR